MKQVIAMCCGLTFGAGLAISGMMNPAKVLAFLDIAGAWDPTLAFVMGSALSVSATGYQIARRRDQTWLGADFTFPTRQDLAPERVGGAALFGVGWGLVGLGPGPALASVSRGSFEIVLFVGAMLVGVAGFRLLTREPAVLLGEVQQ